MLQATKDLTIYICGIKPSTPPPIKPNPQKRKKKKEKEKKKRGSDPLHWRSTASQQYSLPMTKQLIRSTSIHMTDLQKLNPKNMAGISAIFSE